MVGKAKLQSLEKLYRNIQNLDAVMKHVLLVKESNLQSQAQDGWDVSRPRSKFNPPETCLSSH
jgi:hypothetical protein